MFLSLRWSIQKSVRDYPLLRSIMHGVGCHHNQPVQRSEAKLAWP